MDEIEILERMIKYKSCQFDGLPKSHVEALKIAVQALKKRNEDILRGRDDLNSNKTPKEFCKDKKGIGGMKMDYTNEELKHIWSVMIFRANDGDYLTEELDKQIANKLDKKYIKNGNWKVKELGE